MIHLRHYLDYTLHREITSVYISMAVRELALSMIALFVPIYLYLHFGYSLSKVFLFYAAAYGFYAFLTPVAAKIMSKIGLKHSILISVPLTALFYFGLIKIDYAVWVLPLVVVANILCRIFFWPAFHIDFMRFSQTKQRAREFGLFRVFILIAGVAGPVAGGFFLQQFGFPLLFTLTIILLFVSVAPLFLNPEIREQYDDSYERAVLEVAQKRNWRFVLGFSGQAIEDTVSMFIWPLFLLILAIDFSSMGVIVSGALLLALLFTFVAGKLSDRIGGGKILRFSSVWLGVSWLLRLLANNPFSAFLFLSFSQIAFVFTHIPAMAAFYDEAARRGSRGDEFVIFRELIVNLAKGIVCLILSGVFLFTSHFAFAFVLAAFGAMLMMVLSGQKTRA